LGFEARLQARGHHRAVTTLSLAQTYREDATTAIEEARFVVEVAARAIRQPQAP
jgi:hypothetical protein